jgi:hypothetical protein
MVAIGVASHHLRSLQSDGPSREVGLAPPLQVRGQFGLQLSREAFRPLRPFAKRKVNPSNEASADIFVALAGSAVPRGRPSELPEAFRCFDEMEPAVNHLPDYVLFGIEPLESQPALLAPAH